MHGIGRLCVCAALMATSCGTDRQRTSPSESPLPSAGGGEVADKTVSDPSPPVPAAAPAVVRKARAKPATGDGHPHREGPRPPRIREADAQRIADVHRIAEIIERYKVRVGTYPFTERWKNVPPGRVAIPIGVYVSSRKLPEQYHFPPPGVTGGIISAAELAEYLGDALGEPITLPEDKLHPDHWTPYQVWFYEDHYFVSCHLTGSTPHTRPVGSAHKYQVGSMAVPEKKIREYLEIESDW